MTISAKIIADSVAPGGEHRLTTLQLRYPRFIHAEFMTHRVFSRNASSSRAIPVSRLIDDILKDPVYPSHWGLNQKGMQADGENSSLVQLIDMLPDFAEATRKHAWDDARRWAIGYAEAFDAAGYHKQIVNRLLEPFSHINVVVSATEWSNFFALRRHDDAQPEIHELADRMHEAMEASVPQRLVAGDWHLPYIDISPSSHQSWQAEKLDKAIQCSVARCARVSYLTQEGGAPSEEADLKLYDRLVGSHPMHASPAEHQASPDSKVWVPNADSLKPKDIKQAWRNPEHHGNFKGWRQYRKLLEGECQ